MGDGFPTVKAAAVQASSVFLDRERTLEKARELIVEAGQHGADVTVFPEGYLPGHPLWFHFHPATGAVSVDLSTRLFKNAVEVPGPETERLARAAQRAGSYVTMGVCEKEPDTTGTMYNSQLFFSPDGELIGRHQKIKPTVGEQLVHTEGRNDTFGAVETDFGPLSGLICGENSNPLAIAALAAEHTRVHAMSWPPSFRTTGAMAQTVLNVSRAFAQMSKAFVVSANGVLDERALELMELDEETAEQVTRPENQGGSVIVGPDMSIVAGPLDDDDDILYGELDLEIAVKQKLNHDFAGHYNRPDLFQLRVDRTCPELVTDTTSLSADAAKGTVREADTLGTDTDELSTSEGSAPKTTESATRKVPARETGVADARTGDASKHKPVEEVGDENA